MTVAWHRRVNLSIFGMIVVDAYLAATGAQGHNAYASPNHFFTLLAQQLIDNTVEERVTRRAAQRLEDRTMASLLPTRRKRSAEVCLDTLRHGTCPTPTKRMKKTNRNQRQQGKCMVCSAYSTNVCRTCQRHLQRPTDKQHWICNKPGKACMGHHICKAHRELILPEGSN